MGDASPIKLSGPQAARMRDVRACPLASDRSRTVYSLVTRGLLQRYRGTHRGGSYDLVRLTDAGRAWLDANPGAAAHDAGRAGT